MNYLCHMIALQPSASREDYLKAIYVLEDESQGPVSTNALSERVQAKPASVSGMLKQLAEGGWVDHTAYRGVSLTAAGRGIAVDVIRRHRLWEVFLVDRLGFGWDEVHNLAEQLEHVEHAELMNRLDAFLGHPAFDPHGDPIPRADGTVVDPRRLITADALHPGQMAVVKGVVDSSDAFLRHLDALGISLGTAFEVSEWHGFDGSASIVGKGLWTAAVLRNLYVEING